jgi:hypothetical protein
MADLAAHLVENVLGGLPVRQWVLTLPHSLRYALAWDHGLCRAVLGVFIRALLTFERRRAERRGIRQGRGGAVTAIQRFGSALNLNVHFHTLDIQGVFVDDSRGGLRFVPNPEPTDLEVAELLASVSRRITNLAKRRGINLDRAREEIDTVDLLGHRVSVSVWPLRRLGCWPGGHRPPCRAAGHADRSSFGRRAGHLGRRAPGPRRRI